MLIDELVVETLLVEHRLLPRRDGSHVSGADRNKATALVTLYLFCGIVH